MSARPLKLTGLLAGAALLTATQAFAHAELESSDPAANSTVAAPEAITLVFSDEIAPAFSGFDLVKAADDATVPVKTEVSEDGRTMTGAPEAPLAAGAYRIDWHAASDDGHRMEGEIAFTVE